MSGAEVLFLMACAYIFGAVQWFALGRSWPGRKGSER